MLRKSFVFLGMLVSGCGACYASSYTECIHGDCYPMSGVNKTLERFMKMEEEFVSSVKCLGNHLNDLEKLDMRLGAQENYIRSIRLKLQGLIYGYAGGSDGYAGMPNIQNNLNSQTVINNQTTMNNNNTCINNNFTQNFQNKLQQHGIAKEDAKDEEISKLQAENKELKAQLKKKEKENKTGEMSEEDKGLLKAIYNGSGNIIKAEIRAAWPWITDNKIKPNPIINPLGKK